MIIILVVAFLWFTNWLFSSLLVFIPLNLWHGVESLLWSGILGVGVIVLSWLLGEN